MFLSAPVRFLTQVSPVLILLAGCANPVLPAGGPPDRTPPEIAGMTPAANAVNVTADVIQIVFSEYVDQNAFTRAFSITPQFDEPVDFRWRGQTVNISFPGPLRDNTTYILTIDTNLRDEHGVALTQPVTVAFSTGPEINKGRLAGRVVDPQTGKGAAGMDVYAYALPDSTPLVSLPENPDYRTQTGADGQFQFDYLSEQGYFVLALQDRNRSRRPESLEPFAVPPRYLIDADTLQQQEVRRWYVTALDTIAPELQRVRALSSRRLELRFSEPVHLTTRTAEEWVLRDSLQNQPRTIRSIYTLSENPNVVFVTTDSLSGGIHLLRPASLADSSGNSVLPQFFSFTPSAAADTVSVRFMGFAPDTVRSDAQAAGGLFPGEDPGVRFNLPLDPKRLEAVVSVRDSTGAPRLFTAETSDGTTYRILADPAFEPGRPIQVLVNGRTLNGADTVYTRTFQRMSQRNLGELSGYVRGVDSLTAVVVELQRAVRDARPEPLKARADAEGRFFFPSLPEGNYRLRAFLDPDMDMRWDGGRISPYHPADLLTWGPDSIRVRARWETALEDTLYFPPRAP